jgi:hypothetical protein
VKKIYLITIFIVLFLLFIGWFYWYQYRPTEIRSYCDGWAREKENLTIEGYRARYESCLHSKGLE